MALAPFAPSGPNSSRVPVPDEFPEGACRAAGEINLTENDITVSGYDRAAYFAAGKPTKGKTKYTATHDGAIYQFASSGNRDLFKADPEKYAPQYGGFCAFGVIVNRKFNGDPESWYIADGKLYLTLIKMFRKSGWTMYWVMLNQPKESGLRFRAQRTLTLAGVFYQRGEEILKQ